MWVSRLLFVATLIQRFGSAGKAKTAVCRRQEAVLVCRKARALNLNIHFHMLFLDGVYIDCTNKSLVRFRWVKAPTSDELTQLTHTIARRIAHYLERQGLLVRDVEGAYSIGIQPPVSKFAQVLWKRAFVLLMLILRNWVR